MLRSVCQLLFTVAALACAGMAAQARPVGDEFQVNTYTASHQLHPAVARLGDRGFVVVWHSLGQDSHGDPSFGVYGQRFGANGKPKGKEFRVNSHRRGDQFGAAVAPLIDGGFVVAWDSDSQDGSGYGVYGQQYDLDGNPVSGEFQINTYTTDNQDSPSVAGLADGGFVVIWESYRQDGSRHGVYGRRYNVNGKPEGDEFQVNTDIHGDQILPSVAATSDGFVVVWDSDGQDGNDFEVFGRRYDAGGAPIGNEFQINTTPTQDQYGHGASVAVLSDGGFVVTWDSWQSSSRGFDIFCQRYDTGGNPVGGEFRVNSHTSDLQWNASVTGMADGGFVVAWESLNHDGDSSGVFGQRYDVDSNNVKGEFQANTYTRREQQTPALAALDNGRFVVVWDSIDQDGDGYGVFGQLFK